MWEGPFLLGGSVLTLAVLVVAQAPDPLERVQLGRLGASSIKTLQFTGSGATFTVGQNFRPPRSSPCRWCSKLCSNRVGNGRSGQARTESRSGSFRPETARFGEIRKRLIGPWAV